MIQGTCRYLFAFAVTLMLASCSSVPDISEYRKPAGFKLESPRLGAGAATDQKTIFVFGGSNQKGLLNDVEILDPATKNVQVLKNHIIPRRYFSSVYDDNNHVYLIGGISASKQRANYESTVEVFNNVTRKVTKAATLPYPTRTNTAVYLDGKIYVLGGSHHDWQTRKLKPTALMAVYDISKDEWSLGAPMPTAKSTSAVTWQNKIYVVGGYTGEEQLDVFEQYDPATKKWKSLPPLPEPVSAHTTTVWRDYLIVFGDYNNLDAVWTYDFKAGTWHQSDLSMTGVRHAKAVTYNDAVYLIGGNQDSPGPVLDTIQIFDAKQLRQAVGK
ncbi:MAG: kelch repeat-containing protein [Pseudomonadota bacterium]|nr:kelch repeat-containing protein [Pseudomonadota bacterium]